MKTDPLLTATPQALERDEADPIRVSAGGGVASSSSTAAPAAEQGVASEKLARIFKGAADFAVDNSTFTEAQIRATFYPKFENEKSDQEVSGWGPYAAVVQLLTVSIMS